MTDSQKLDLLLEQMSEFRKELGELREDVSELKTDVAQLKTDVAQLKTDVAQLKTDVAQLKTDVTQLKEDVSELKERVSSLEGRMSVVEATLKETRVELENFTNRAISILAENHLSLMEKLNHSIKAADTNSVYEVKVEYLTERVNKLERAFVQAGYKIA